jgi:hypothetical protein
MEQSPSWEANSHAGGYIPRLLWNPKVHYRVHKSPPLVPILRHMHPVHSFPPSFFKIHFYIILQSMPRSSEWPLTFRFSDQNFVRISHLPVRATCTAHLILLDLITLVKLSETYKLRSSLLCIPLQPPATSSLLAPNIRLSTLFTGKTCFVIFFPTIGTGPCDLTLVEKQRLYYVITNISRGLKPVR